MANQNAAIDSNFQKSMLGVTDDVSAELRRLLVDATTGRLKVAFNGTLTGNVIITGNLTVQGTTTLQNTASVIGLSTFTIDDANNNTVTQIIKLIHTTSGTAAAGIGTGLLYQAENGSGTTVDAVQTSAILTTVTAASETSAFAWLLKNAGAALAEVARMTPTGLGIGSVFGTTPPTHALTFPSSSTGIAIYNTADQTTNFERLVVSFAANVLTMSVAAGGSGTSRAITISVAGSLITIKSTNTSLIITETAGASGFYQLNRVWTSTASAVGVAFSGTSSASSGTNVGCSMVGTISQSGSAGYTAWFTNITESSVGTGPKLLIDLQIGASSKFTVDDLGHLQQAVNSRVSTQFDKTSNTTLSAITGLSATLVAGKTYEFRIVLHVTAGASGGVKFDLNGGSASATSLIANYILVDNSLNTNAITSRQTTLAGSAGNTGITSGILNIYGTITVNAAGTFIPEFAQNVSNGTTSSVLVGSYMVITQIA